MLKTSIYLAPFVDIPAFFEEYCSFHSLQHTPVDNVECEDHDGIRLLRAKGTLNTCEKFNIASDIIRRTILQFYYTILYDIIRYLQLYNFILLPILYDITQVILQFIILYERAKV